MCDKDKNDYMLLYSASSGEFGQMLCSTFFYHCLLPLLLFLFQRMFYDEELEESERFYSSQPQILQLCYALYNMLVAHSEMVCYLVIILNHMVSASVATLILPILIFLWAMLSVPRPSKRFWMTAIVYTEVQLQ